MAESGLYRVLWTETARQDLAEIIDYIAQDSLDCALVILSRLEGASALLTTLPNRGRIVAELLSTGVSQYREVISTPWRIVYHIENKRILIMAVFDVRRDLQTLLLNRLVR